jgi:hypothetical protein
VVFEATQEMNCLERCLQQQQGSEDATARKDCSKIDSTESDEEDLHSYFQ